MQVPDCYEHYPSLIVIGSNFLSILIYGIGAFILYQFGLIWVICYLLFILLLEFRLLSGHCVDCYYYGKTCAFGKGRLSSLFFQMGNPEKFNQKMITWKEIVPDFWCLLFPFLQAFYS